MDKYYLYYKENKPGKEWYRSIDYRTRGGVVNLAHDRMLDILERTTTHIRTSDYDKLQRKYYKLAIEHCTVQFCGWVFKIVVKVVE